MAPSNTERGSPLLGDTNRLQVPELAVYMVYLTQFIDALAGSISTPIMPAYAASFHASLAMVGYLFACWSLTSTVFAPCLSRLGDKIGRRPVLIMSLVGAGTASLIQGLAPNVWVFVFGRAFSGIWAAVGATCQVYITDVAPEDMRPALLGRLSMVPILGILFGPGLGGGLSTFGLNCPILVDGVITLFSALLVSIYLPETPAFVRTRATGSTSDGGEVEQDDKKPSPKIPRMVHVLGISSFLWGISFSTLVSMYAIIMHQKFGLNALQVGYCFVSNAICMIASNVWLVKRFQAAFGPDGAAIVGSLVNAVGFLAFAWSPAGDTWNMYAALFWMYLGGGLGGSIRSASSGAITAEFTEPSNRGKIFAIVQTYSNLGRLVGPVIMGHLAEIKIEYTFTVAAVAGLLSGLFLIPLVVTRRRAQAAVAPSLRRGPTSYGKEWIDEVGTKEDVEAMGKFITDILAQRHYKWISRRSEIMCMLDKLLPELNTGSQEEYEEHLEQRRTIMCRSTRGGIGQ